MRAPAGQAGTVSDLIRLYCQSAGWGALRATTRATYQYAIDRIEAEFFDMQLASLGRRGARRMILDWRDEIARDTPRMADLCVSVFQALLRFAVERELITDHPLERVAKIHDGTRRDIIWMPAQIAAFKAKAPAHMVRAMVLAMWTGQRQGDLLRLTWASYDADSLVIRQSKTGALVRVAASEELREALKSFPRTAVTILTTETGRPWGSGFKSSWAKAVAAAGIEDAPTFHDLRGTFVTIAYRNGASIREIAEVTGHSERDAERIIRKHYLVSRGAVEAIEAGTKSVKLFPKV
jgi:integrase